MWEQTAVSVEILDIVRRWLNRPRDGRVEVRVFGRSVLLVEWGGRAENAEK